MELRRIGSSDLLIAPVGFNAVSFTPGCGAVDLAEAAAIIALLLDTTTAFVDLNDLGGTGEVESLVGRAVRGRRGDVVLAARAGARYTVHGRLTGVDAAPGALVLACEASLRRLGTDHVDVYVLDRVDPHVPVEESIGALAALVTAGKVRHIGVANMSADQLRRAHAVHPVAIVAAEYSLVRRDVEAEILPAARALGAGLAAYSPLGGGVLTGSAALDKRDGRDHRRHDPRFDRDVTRIRAVVRQAGRLATLHHLGMARLALAWLLGQGADIVPVPGTRSLTHLEMNLAAAGVVVTAADLAELGALFAPFSVGGASGDAAGAGGGTSSAAGPVSDSDA